MCKLCKNPAARVIKKGFFKKKKARRIQRYYCHHCGKTFSDQTDTPSYRLRKFHLRNLIFREFCSSVSQREMARKIGVHQDTIARFLPRMARMAAPENAQKAANSVVPVVVFDEMETFEHTKCKPVSIVVAVEETHRTILSLIASQMPAKGRLAKISVKKYGKREDFRPGALRETMRRLSQNIHLTTLKSDECPRYPKYVRERLPGIVHTTYKGRRGCVVGQGELKRGGFDPLFSLNHTCAMIRDFIKRLTRRTWCTTKRIDRLQMVLDLYMNFFNQRLQGKLRPKLV